jgi:hypothetical protein
VGRLRSWVRRLERATQDDQLSILQEDGTIAKFPADAALEAFGHEANRMTAIHRGEDPGEAHPLTVAKRNALYPGEFGYVFDADRQPRKEYRIPDRSEPDV